MYARARAVLPGGNSRTAVYNSPYPIYAAAGQGCRVVDLDGTSRLDFLGNSTTLVHGHAHPEIVAAISEAAARGTCFGLPTEAEVLFAEALCARSDAYERARFTSSGTEAVMMAVQAARAHTGRPKIAKCAGSYHGAYDSVAVNNDGSGSLISHSHTAGMPQAVLDNTIIIPFNDPEGATEVLRAHAGELACALIDPVPWRSGLVPATAEYIAALRAVCDETGVLLVSDEVGSFRAGFHGAIDAIGGVADLTVLGKVIGGGMPIGAVVGKAEVMAVFDPSEGKPKLPHSGSYNANPVSMSAGVASLRLLTEAEWKRIGGLGEQLRDTMRKTIADNGLDWEVNGVESLFRVVTGTVPDSSVNSARLGHLLFQELLLNGVLIGDSGLGCVSTPMGQQEVDTYAEAFDAAVGAVVEQARAQG
ncbi:hypothetical protein BJP25_23260 [Actinokineospora bangkokensis]|uniref:Aspartate aminotransferase family protein n=2 Tax=Actinokineospora bangkokensis TaxID=1193682 RepID=A0A1Q9LJZ4_9PSEU|nr:hypothetical protein BJP25_23260 [Actinokineospora bangkokensis]